MPSYLPPHPVSMGQWPWVEGEASGSWEPHWGRVCFPRWGMEMAGIQVLLFLSQVSQIPEEEGQFMISDMNLIFESVPEAEFTQGWRCGLQLLGHKVTWAQSPQCAASSSGCKPPHLLSPSPAWDPSSRATSSGRQFRDSLVGFQNFEHLSTLVFPTVTVLYSFVTFIF